jgi:hypothetical protein
LTCVDGATTVVAATTKNGDTGVEGGGESALTSAVVERGAAEGAVKEKAATAGLFAGLFSAAGKEGGATTVGETEVKAEAAGVDKGTQANLGAEEKPTAEDLVKLRQEGSWMDSVWGGAASTTAINIARTSSAAIAAEGVALESATDLSALVISGKASADTHSASASEHPDERHDAPVEPIDRLGGLEKRRQERRERQEAREADKKDRRDKRDEKAHGRIVDNGDVSERSESGSSGLARVSLVLALVAAIVACYRSTRIRARWFKTQSKM